MDKDRVLWFLTYVAVTMCIYVIHDLDLDTLVVPPGKRFPTFSAAAFQRDRTNCSVRMITSRSELEPYLKEQEASQKCTLKQFKQYLLQNRQFMGEGVWLAPPDGHATMDTDFYPKYCTFSNDLSSTEAQQNCFLRKGVRKILISGDSHAERMWKMLVDNVKQLHGNSACTSLDSTQRNVSYFAVPHATIDLNSIRKGWTNRCTLSNNSTLILELLGMHNIVEHSIQLEKDVIPGSFETRLTYSSTKIAYLLKYYFPHRGFPDLWILNMPFLHTTWGNSVRQAKADLEYALNIMDIYLPKTTTVVFVATTRECPDLRPPEVSEIYNRIWNMTRNQHIYEMNQMLYHVFWENMESFPNFYPFLDADKLSCPLVCSWHVDGAHLVEYWYAKMIRYILESFCD